MLGEFIHQGDVYNVRTELDEPSPDEKPIKLHSLKEAQSFFAYAMLDPMTRKELLDIAKWLKPSTCRAPQNCPKPNEQELVDLLVLRVYEGDLRLFIYKPSQSSGFKIVARNPLWQLTILMNALKFLIKPFWRRNWY